MGINKSFGFTLIELIIVMAITGIIIVGSYSIIGLNFKSQNELDLTVREIISVLRNAQDRSISQEDSSQWGVYFENSVSNGGFYVLYKGATTTFVSKKILRSNIQFLDPVSDSSKNISFSLLNGFPNSSTTVKIALKNDPSKTKIIFISNNGQIDGSYCSIGVQDIDGNMYNTVIIGDQCWMKENMRTTKYPDGSPITDGTYVAASQWNTDYSYYSCPPNTSNTGPDCAAALPPTNLGYLYQWSAAMNSVTAEGGQGICPAGWHIPTNSEQHILDNYLKDSGQACDAIRTTWGCATAGEKLKSEGSSGFEGLLVGYRYYNGDDSFSSRDSTTDFWASTQSGSSAWTRALGLSFTTVHRDANSKAYGMSIRCLKN